MDTIKKFFEDVKTKMSNASVIQMMRLAASILTVVGCGAIAVSSFTKETDDVIDISNEAKILDENIPEVVDMVLDEAIEPVE